MSQRGVFSSWKIQNASLLWSSSSGFLRRAFEEAYAQMVAWSPAEASRNCLAKYPEEKLTLTFGAATCFENSASSRLEDLSISRKCIFRPVHSRSGLCAESRTRWMMAELAGLCLAGEAYRRLQDISKTGRMRRRTASETAFSVK